MSQIDELISKIVTFDYTSLAGKIFSLLSLENFLKFVVAYFFVVWIAIIIWVTKDIVNRTNNILLQALSILIVLVGTPLGIIVYLLIRPSKTLFEKYQEMGVFENDLEDSSSEENSKQIQPKKFCFHCNYEIKDEYNFCPNCRSCLKKECVRCGKELKPEWSFCPNCGKDQESKNDKTLKSDKEEQKEPESKKIDIQIEKRI